MGRLRVRRSKPAQLRWTTNQGKPAVTTQRPGRTPAMDKLGGYSGGRPASEMGPPPPLPSATIRPRVTVEPTTIREAFEDDSENTGPLPILGREFLRRPNVPTASPAGEALVQQIAETLRGWWHQPPGADTFWVEAARAVLPLVEAKVAPLRDEVERLTDDVRVLDVQHSAAVSGWRGQKDRADAAESALRQVREDLRALAERGYSGTHASINSAWRADIAAVLAIHGGQR